MKPILLSFVLLFSTSAFSKTVRVKGMQAKALMDVADELNSTDAAMGGRLYADLTKVHCEKTVDDERSIYFQKCSFVAFENVAVETRSDAEENRQAAEHLRAALIDIAKNEIKVSPFKKTIDINRVECKAIGIGHSLDAIDIEPTYKCSLDF